MADIAASVVFMAELTLRLCAVKWSAYFNSYYNTFDATVILLCFVGIWGSAWNGDNAIRLVRLFRVLQASLPSMPPEPSPGPRAELLLTLSWLCR